MTTDLEVSLPLAFYYDTKKPVPIPDVIKALSALERMSLGSRHSSRPSVAQR